MLWGGHKFYEGKAGTGILYLFTGGLFSIGWIIDSSVFCVSPIHITYIKQQPFLSIQKQAGEVLLGKNLPGLFFISFG
ncbi:MAG: TM2 domain-containing protein [[Clostridium] leptum]